MTKHKSYERKLGKPLASLIKKIMGQAFDLVV